ncbi:MAG: molybdopterin-dependent oxidoreductase [Ilumatobacteraceae bacterium]
MTDTVLGAEGAGARAEWQPTACILCECNCGIEVRLGGDSGTRFERIRGDKAHPASQGYTCEKALRLDHYQHQPRLTTPLRRRDDGTFEAIDWDTAIGEIADRFAAIRAAHGGESIFYYGGGGQGNHLGGGYSGATLRALGAKYRANALSQEKTGEFWVNGKMFGAMLRADFEHAEAALFVGKNPWQSHGLARARTVLKEIANDPGRAIIVIDPKRSETAELADFHLQVRPGTDAFCLAAMVAVLVQEGLVRQGWLDEHTTGAPEIIETFAAVPVADFAERCGVGEQLIRGAARRLAAASSVAVAEDLGIQMNRHSTLNSWLEKLVWVLTGNFGVPGSQYLPSSLVALVRSGGKAAEGAPDHVSPVVGAKIISGLVPCNVVPEEILTDHPRRYRAMLVESGNPAHSLADTRRMREALEALELVVVIDVAMTETARLAHYVLPAPTQFEKWEATFFNFDFPHNVFHLRKPILPAPEGVLPEPEIHARLVEALGAIRPEQLAPLRAAAERGRGEFAAAFFDATSKDPSLGALAPIVLYRTLGPTLPDGAVSAAILWGAAHRCALNFEASVRRAGFTGEGLELGEALFDAILTNHHGVTFTVDEWDEVWRRLGTADGRIHLVVPELLDELAALPDDPPIATEEFPLVLSAGERRSFTANTIIRDAGWRKRDAEGALRVSPSDAAALDLTTGARVRIVTGRGAAEVVVEVYEGMQPGHISLPNGLGLDQPVGEGLLRTGVAPNELTDSFARDPIAGTPWHKSVPARLEHIA